MKQNCNDLLFRASECGNLMGTIGLTDKQKVKLNELADRKNDPKAKPLTTNMENELSELEDKLLNPEVPEGLQKYLTECYIQYHYGRSKKLENKYITKGLEVEKMSLDLYDVVCNKLGGVLVQNETRLNNEYITGKPDVFKGDTVLDLKSSWDLFTFFDSMDKVNKTYYWQLQAYMALTGLHKAELAYCLIDTPLALIHDEQRRLQWKMNAMDNDPEYVKACEEIEFNHQYPDIPKEKRVHVHYIERNEQDIQALYERVRFCRNWINKKFYQQ